MKKLIVSLIIFTAIILGSMQAYADIISSSEMKSFPAFINKQGKIVQVSEYKSYFSSSEKEDAVIPVRDKSRRFGYQDKNKQWIIEPQYEYAEPFSEDIAGVCINNKCGYIDINNNWIIEPKFQFICQMNINSDIDILRRYCHGNSIFSEGLAPIVYRTQKKYNIIENSIDDIQYKGYINKEGKLVIKLGDVSSVAGFSEGLAAVCKKRELCGYIDKKGKWVIKPQYLQAYSFKNGIAYVRLKGLFTTGQYRHKPIIPKEYTELKKAGKIADNNNKILIPFSIILLLLIITAGYSIKKSIKKAENEKSDK